LDAFDDGAWWVELAPLSDPALVPQAVASALGVRPQPGQALTETLTYYLRPKELLLVLDNCEHLIGACRGLIQALASTCPKVQIIATSREALNIMVETTWQVAALSLPEPEAPTNLEELNRSEAIRLFVDRASVVLPSFALTMQIATPVAQIVRRLDGLPLAIELAAARVRMLSPTQIAARLDNAFTLLTRNSAEAPPRHQTFQAAMDWSFDLLSLQERTALRRLSVFAGGFTLESVESVCADAVGQEGISSNQVLDLLSDLVDKSLVMVVEWEHGEQARYGLLEAIRQYAREKLLDAGESERLRDQHRDFFLNLAEQAEPMLLQGARRAAWLQRLKVEQDNLRAALAWACERNPEVARWLAGTLCWFWFFGDYLSEARVWCERVLELGGRSKKTTGLAKALFSQGVAYAFEYSFEEAREPLEQSAALWRELGDQRMLAQPLAILAYSLMSLGQDASACAIFDENESLLRQSADRFILAVALTYWGREIANTRRDYAAAKALHEEALALGRDLKDPFLLGCSFMNLGYLAFQQGEYQAARHYHLESLAERRQLGTRWLIAIALRNVADVMCVQGDYQKAQLAYEEALELHRAIGERMGAAYTAFRLGYVAVCRNNYAQAAARFADSLEIYRASTERLGVASCLSGCAELQRAQGRQEEAVRMLAFVDGLLQSSQCKLRYVERVEYERTLATSRAQMDEATFNAAWQAGREMTLEQAMASALAPRPAG
jgi:non-specific serine/threonine protein kinase